MDVREYIAIRRAYNTLRQNAPSKSRLTFEEISVLALLDSTEEALPTSAIASWQHALRPTMTHRASHLAGLGLIRRVPGIDDRRNVVCEITESGVAELDALCEGIRLALAHGKVLTRIDSSRVKRYLLAMGQRYLQASDLVIIGLAADGGGVSLYNGESA